jgi:hypothetical protein
MPWTNPKTWVANEDTTAALLNTYVRDNLMMFGPSRPSAWVCQSAATSIAHGIFSATNPLFAFELWDTDGFHSTTTNTDRLTVPAGMDGFYLIQGSINFAANATGKRLVLLYTVGSISGLRANRATDASNFAGGQSVVGVSLLCYMNAGDYTYLACTQDSGAALNTSGNFTSWFSITWLGKDPF